MGHAGGVVPGFLEGSTQTPKQPLTLAVHVQDAKTAIQALSVALNSPFEVSAAAYDPQYSSALLRLEGFADSVTYRETRLRSELANFGEVTKVQDPVSQWRSIRDVRAFQGSDGDVWRISVKPGDAPEIATRAEAEKTIFDWGGGLVWALVPKGTDLRKRLRAFQGHATLVRADTDTVRTLGRFQPESIGVAALTRGLRQKFDPRDIFNPGLMG